MENHWKADFLSLDPFFFFKQQKGIRLALALHCTALHCIDLSLSL